MPIRQIEVLAPSNRIDILMKRFFDMPQERFGIVLDGGTKPVGNRPWDPVTIAWRQAFDFRFNACPIPIVHASHFFVYPKKGKRLFAFAGMEHPID